MLSKKYLNSIKNVPTIMKKIIEGTAPERFTTEHLKKIGFSSSNDRALVGVLKDLGFLTDDGTPTQKYHEYRNTANSKKVLGEALKVAYSDVFHLNEKPTQSDKASIAGLFKTTHNVSDMVAGFMANTFLTLLDLADITNDSKTKIKTEEGKSKIPKDGSETQKQTTSEEKPPVNPLNLRYDIEIHLPATKDIEVYNAIFKSIRENLLNE